MYYFERAPAMISFHILKLVSRQTGELGKAREIFPLIHLNFVPDSLLLGIIPCFRENLHIDSEKHNVES